MNTPRSIAPFFLLLLLMLAGLGAAPARAQQGDTASAQTAPDDTAGTALPDIAPREVEIRGELEISLPSLERQPLTGFNPAATPVPEIAPERRPYVAPYKQESADLPPSPLPRPEPPSAAGLQAPPPIQGLVEASGGRYFDRAVYARTSAPLSPTETFHGQLDYRGTSGHEPFEDDLNAPFNTLEADLRVETQRFRFETGGALHGFADAYDLYGAVPVDPSEPPERAGRGAGLDLWARTPDDLPLTARARLQGGTTRFETEQPLLGTSPWLRERRFGFEAGLDVPFETLTFLANLDYTRAGLRGDDAVDGRLSSFAGAFHVRLPYREDLTLTAGVTILSFTDDTEQPAPGEVRRSYLLPMLRAVWQPAPDAQVYAQQRPALETNPLAELFRRNPYLVSRPVVRPTMRTVDFEVGGELFRGPVHLAGRAGYQRMPQYLFFEQADAGATGFARGFSAARYEAARILHVGAEASVDLPFAVQAALGLSLRDGALTQANTHIPYFAPVVGHASASYAFAERRGLLQLVGTYERARPVDRREDAPEVGAYVDVDLHASYALDPTLGLVARLENVIGGALERWDRYPQAPFILAFGVRMRW